jgi:D-lactate dehydrogenase
MLDEGHLGGVGMDVYENEAAIAGALRSSESEHPDAAPIRRLLRNPRVILTPHNAFNTTESVQRKAQATAKQLIKFQQDKRFDPQLV